LRRVALRKIGHAGQGVWGCGSQRLGSMVPTI
jgi:hypothetical protein